MASINSLHPRFMEKRCKPTELEEEEEESLTSDPEFHTFCPIEFKMRILVGILNELDIDATLDPDDKSE